MSIKILYAEDEVSLGKIVKETLESRGYLVFLQTDGAAVMPLFAACKPDVCILDIMLPNQTGFELAIAIRKISEHVPILFLTAKTQVDDVVKGFKLGGNDYLKKPFSMEELMVRIENLLKINKNTQQEQEMNILKIGQYSFNKNKQLLICNAEEKRLSFRESELLKYLYTNRNHIIERKELLNHIWGNDSFFNSRNLDVYITKLRSYFKDDPAIEIITMKGVGYRFALN
jgi:DNA-binding response OmpR family regulator